MNAIKKLKNKLFSLLFIFIILCGYLLVFYVKNQVKETFQNSPKPRYSVVIDAGHGGIDKGATGKNNTLESEINLQIAFELESLFIKGGYNVLLTRTDDNGLYDDLSPGFKKRDLQKRVEITNNFNPDVFISIHLNTYAKEYRRGAQVFFKKGNDTSKILADGIQLELNLLKESKRMFDALSGDYYLLNFLKMPAVIVECGFLSNPEEESLLASKSYQKTLSKAIYLGVIRYFYKL
ncbi:MAG: N-acetylmuramoyl-L-alanine amidase [Clostridia bacterium]|nr:N-acetylmuramoyl-L-alanine amidase [Clostridia bacterium]